MKRKKADFRAATARREWIRYALINPYDEVVSIRLSLPRSQGLLPAWRLVKVRIVEIDDGT